MGRFLLDTNAFFELLSFLAGKNVRRDGYDFAEILNGECYISKITELEIISVIGKYGRGEASQWQKCARQIHEDGTKCEHHFFYKGKIPWSKSLCREMNMLVKEMIKGSSPILKLHVLELDEEIVNRAERFLVHASKHKFGSQDALIAATSLVYSSDEIPMVVVTSDKELKAAMAEEGMQYVVPGVSEVMV